MQCSRCRAENRQGRRFCAECGAALALACPACGFSNEPGERFCGGCGAPLGSSATVAEPKFGAPESYTPKHLAEKILTSKSALEGERKQVTVLFADLKGSMELLADRDPEEARRLLDPVLERMIEAVHRYEGTVNQVMGDGIMALFGAPLAHEDHAVRACYAALRMQDAVRRYSDTLRHAQGVEAQIRVGLNSGEVVVRSIGSDLRMDYTAVGQTTHLAARMEQLAVPGTARLTGDTLRLAEGYVEVRALGPIPVKGLANPVEIFELTGAGPARTRLQAAAVRGLTPFVGRDAEVEHLRRVLGRAAAGHGQVVAIVGEAGVGKSRLTYEFTHSHRVQDWLVLEAASVSYGKATSYLPVIDLLKSYFKIGDRDTHREMRDKVVGRVLGLDRALEPLLLPLLELLDIPVEDTAWRALDALQRRQRTLDAAKRLLLRESQVQPLLVVAEDLHWIDGETQALLDSLVESLGSARVLLLVNYRPEYQHGWGSKTAYSQMRLDALAAESAGELLESLLGNDPGLAPLKQLLVKRGNPFFLEETVQMLLETKALEGSRGRYRLTQPLQTLQVPPTVQTILAARIDRLTPEDKRLLQTASVVGKDVPFALLQAIAQLPDEALRGGLDRLRAAEFLYETGLFPDLEYAFKHALTHEVTYASLLQERRRNLHARIVEAIETLYRDRVGEHIERLAEHAVRGNLSEKAVEYLRQSGAKAISRSAYTNAVAALEQGLAILDRLPETRSTIEQGVDMRLDLRNALTLLTEPGRSLEICDEAARLAEKLGDRRRIGWAWAIQSMALYTAFRRREALTSAERACAAASEVGDIALRWQASCSLAIAAVELGEFRRVEETLTPVVTTAMDPAYRDQLTGNVPRSGQRGAAGHPAVVSLGFLAISLAMRGKFAEARRRSEDQLRTAKLIGQPNLIVLASIHTGRVLGLQGDFRRAAEVLGRGHAVACESDLTMQVPGVTALLGFARAHAGQRDEAASLLSQAMSQLAPEKPAYLHVVIELGETLALLERSDEALNCARHALDASRQWGEQPLEASALRLLADIAVAGDRGLESAAAADYLKALAIADKLGMRPLMAHCHLGLGKIHRRIGKRELAQEHLTAATTMYREMDMAFWLERAAGRPESA